MLRLSGKDDDDGDDDGDDYANTRQGHALVIRLRWLDDDLDLRFDDSFGL